MKPEYVLGFYFRHSLVLQVALIHKLKPEWQRGKLNGIGGKIEPNETPYEAMIREFAEETGVQPSGLWGNFLTMVFPEAVIHCYTNDYFPGDPDIRSTTDESVEWYPARYLHQDVLPNLRWLVPMAQHWAGNLPTPRIYFDDIC